MAAGFRAANEAKSTCGANAKPSAASAAYGQQGQRGRLGTPRSQSRRCRRCRLSVIVLEHRVHRAVEAPHGGGVDGAVGRGQRASDRVAGAVQGPEGYIHLRPARPQSAGQLRDRQLLAVPVAATGGPASPRESTWPSRREYRCCCGSTCRAHRRGVIGVVELNPEMVAAAGRRYWREPSRRGRRRTARCHWPGNPFPRPPCRPRPRIVPQSQGWPVQFIWLLPLPWLTPRAPATPPQ